MALTNHQSGAGNLEPSAEKNLSSHYKGDEGEAYLTIFPEDMDSGRRFQAEAFAPFCGDDLVVLDFGCCDGLLIRQVAAARYVGVEPNLAAQKLCNALGEKTAKPVELHTSLDTVPEASVDVVMSNHCLEHVPQPLEALREIRRVLVPGGKLLLMTPIDDWRQPNHGEWQPGDMDFHLHTWTPRNIGNLLTEAEFSVKSISIGTVSWHPRLYWANNLLGSGCFSFLSRVLNRLRHRREVFAVAIKPDAPEEQKS